MTRDEAIALVQGTDEWRAARVGSLGASQIHEATARIKSGWGASRANVMAAMIAERLTGVAADGFMSTAMQHGMDFEPEARAAYAFYHGMDVETVGIFTHPKIAGTHASPDGWVKPHGLIEIKCPNTATHIDTLLALSIPEKYVKQMQWQMACSETQWCDFVSYDPRMPENMRLFVRRVPRNAEMIANLEKDVVEFMAELEQRLDALQRHYGTAQAA